MKKNTMMRLASVLLIVTLLTTSVISGTFAKYTTSATANDSARIAYWGFKDTTVEDFSLFKSDDTGILGGDTLLAPGSTKTVDIDFVYTNHNGEATITAPEVDYSFEITLEATGTNITDDLAALDGNDNFYWILNGRGYSTFDAFKTAVENLDGNTTYEAGTFPTTFYNGSNTNKHTIGWIWFFGANTAENTTGLKQATVDAPIEVVTTNDAADTAMGNVADTLNEFTLTLTITATQLD